MGFFPSIIKKSSVLKKMQQQLKHKIHSDMPALLPNLVVNFHTPGQEHISPYAKVDEVIYLKDQNITKRSLGDLVNIVSGIVKGASIIGNIISGVRSVGGMIIDGINTIINYKKAKVMNAAIHTLNKWSSMNNEQIIRVRNHLSHVSKASLADINIASNLRYLSRMLKFYMAHRKCKCMNIKILHKLSIISLMGSVQLILEGCLLH